MRTLLMISYRLSNDSMNRPRGAVLLKQLRSYARKPPVVTAAIALLLLSIGMAGSSAFADTAVPAECENPTSGWIKLSKCTPAGPFPEVIIGGANSTCGQPGSVKVYVD